MNSQDAFERFIDGRYADASAEELKHIVKTYEAGGLSVTFRPDVHTALAKLSEAARQSIEQAIRDQLNDPNNATLGTSDRNAVNIGKLSGFSIGGIVTGVDQNGEALAELRKAVHADRIERLRQAYGEQWIAEAQELAQTRGMSFEQAIAYKQLATVFDSFNASMTALAEIAQAFGAAMAEHINEGIFDKDFEPDNRHTRRASKHARTIKEGDQSWKTKRRYRNRH